MTDPESSFKPVRENPILSYKPRPTLCVLSKKTGRLSHTIKSRIQWLKTTSPITKPLRNFLLKNKVIRAAEIDQMTAINRR